VTGYHSSDRDSSRRRILAALLPGAAIIRLIPHYTKPYGWSWSVRAWADRDRHAELAVAHATGAAVAVLISCWHLAVSMTCIHDLHVATLMLHEPDADGAVGTRAHRPSSWPDVRPWPSPHPHDL